MNAHPEAIAPTGKYDLVREIESTGAHQIKCLAA